MKKLAFRILAIVALLSILLNESCAPVFSDLQSARMNGKGNIDVTPSFSQVSFAEGGESASVQTHFGVQAGLGLSDKTDLRTRIEHISVKGEDFGATVIGVGPKFSIVEDQIAAYIPIGTAIGSDVNTNDLWEIQPTVLATFPVNDLVEINPSLKYIIQLSGGDDLVAINFGIGIGEYGKFVVRPEYGLLYNLGESGHFSHFSLGVNLFPSWDSE